jgi:hypothetical protein
MDKKDYLYTKRYIKSICYNSVVELCKDMHLCDYETNLLLYLNKDYTRTYSSLQLGVSDFKYTYDMKKVLSKVYDYLKRTS